MGGAATVLVTLVAQVSLVGIRVRQVPGRRVVGHGFGGFAERRHQAVNENEDEQEAHRGAMLSGRGPAGKDGIHLPSRS
jgi:hypothetical protein